MKEYKVQQLSNMMYGLLKGTKDRPEFPRECTQIFLCEHCKGNGFFSASKGKPFGEDCEVCNGLGRIQLKFTVSQIELKQQRRIR